MTIHKKKCACGHLIDVEDAYQQGRTDAIADFVSEMKKYYWDKELQSAKDDPCVIDAMINLAIKTAKQQNR